jgi:hypothetical protein
MVSQVAPNHLIINWVQQTNLTVSWLQLDHLILCSANLYVSSVKANTVYHLIIWWGQPIHLTMRRIQPLLKHYICRTIGWGQPIHLIICWGQSDYLTLWLGQLMLLIWSVVKVSIRLIIRWSHLMKSTYFYLILIWGGWSYCTYILTG